MKRRPKTWIALAASATALIPILVWARPCDVDSCTRSTPAAETADPTAQPAPTTAAQDNYPGAPPSATTIPNGDFVDTYPGQPPTAEPSKPSGTYHKYYYLTKGATNITLSASFVDNKLQSIVLQTDGFAMDNYSGSSFDITTDGDPPVWQCDAWLFLHEDGTYHLGVDGGFQATESTN